MEQIIVHQYLVMLAGEPLSLITEAGVRHWEAEGIDFKCRYDEVTVEGEHFGQYRCLFEKSGSHEIFLLVEPPSAPDGFKVVLLDHPPGRLH